jgi:hypothetical protein
MAIVIKNPPILIILEQPITISIYLKESWIKLTLNISLINNAVVSTKYQNLPSWTASLFGQFNPLSQAPTIKVIDYSTPIST